MFSQINYTITSAVLKEWTQKEACVIMQFKTKLYNTGDFTFYFLGKGEHSTPKYLILK